MKDWWHGLSSRERSLVSGLSVIVLILIVYFVIWSPIRQSVTSLRQSVANNRALVSWMQQATAVLKQHQNTDQANQTTDPNQRLAVIQSSLSDVSFSKKVTTLAQTGNSDVRLVISTASFDDLSNWLVALWKQHGIIVKTITIKRLNNQGSVSVNVILTGKSS